MEAEIRDARRDETCAVQRVAWIAWDHTYREIMPGEVRAGLLGRWYLEVSLVQRMGEGVFLVAVADGEIVGFADFCLVYGDEVELAAVYVLPEMQGPVC